MSTTRGVPGPMQQYPSQTNDLNQASTKKRPLSEIKNDPYSAKYRKLNDGSVPEVYSDAPSDFVARANNVRGQALPPFNPALPLMPPFPTNTPNLPVELFSNARRQAPLPSNQRTSVRVTTSVTVTASTIQTQTNAPSSTQTAPPLVLGAPTLPIVSTIFIASNLRPEVETIISNATKLLNQVQKPPSYQRDLLCAIVDLEAHDFAQIPLIQRDLLSLLELQEAVTLLEIRQNVLNFNHHPAQQKIIMAMQHLENSSRQLEFPANGLRIQSDTYALLQYDPQGNYTGSQNLSSIHIPVLARKSLIQILKAYCIVELNAGASNNEWKTEALGALQKVKQWLDPLERMSSNDALHAASHVHMNIASILHQIAYS